MAGTLIVTPLFRRVQAAKRGNVNRQFHKRTERHGFTIIELLVVIAIISILVGLLLPAVQYARATAARMQCTNNLKQVGLALQNYHDTLQSFPPGYRSNYDAAGNDTGPGWGWAACILPQLEQQAVYDAIRFNQNIESAANAATRVQYLKVFICPSDNPPLTWKAKTYVFSGNPIAEICDVASANYIGVFGTTEPGVDGDGVFFRNSEVRIANITDGTSSTMIVGERSLRLGQTTWVGSVTGATLYPQPPSLAPRILNNGSGMVLGHAGDSNGPSAVNSYVNQFSSNHSGGANFLFADGHVSFVQSTINYSVYHALATRQNGETVGGND